MTSHGTVPADAERLSGFRGNSPVHFVVRPPRSPAAAFATATRGSPVSRSFRCASSLFVLALLAVSARGVTITEANHEGRAQLKVETAGATYYYDRAGGGFSRLLDRDGRDWISFRKDPLSGRAAASAGYRGVPNLVFGKDNPDAGAGHPGHDRCESTIIAADAIRTVTRSGRWAWTWRFTEENAVLTIEQADPERPCWFLYEGTIGGRWSPRTHYFGTDRGGPRRETPFGRDKLYERWRWIYFGDTAAPRVLVAAQVDADTASDTLWYMGNSTAELDAADGMVVFGFGRAEKGALLRGAGHRFVLGFVEQPVPDAAAHARVAAAARAWLRDAEAAVRVSETTLHGDMNCFRIETSAATYLYAKRGAGFASLLDPQGRDWIGYRHGGKAAGEYRGLPKSAPSGGYFNCDYGFGKDQANVFTSTITVNEPGHVRIHSETRDGDGACDWDFYPDHATQTLLKVPGGAFWFTYEGAPGGSFDLADDFMLRPGNRRAPLNEPWTEAVPWVVVGATESPHGLLLVNHQTGSPVDSYTPFPYQLNAKNPAHQMAVVAFGRSDWRDAARKHRGQFTRLPARFSIAMTPAATESAAIESLKKIGTPASTPAAENLFGPPSIDVWHGDEQHFGRLGVPQKWINVLGSVQPGDGLASLRYALNDAPSVPLSVGPDGLRLARAGDFNVELEFDALREGPNTLAFIATDATGRATTRTVIVHCHRGRAWPLPYTVEWSKVRSIPDAVQIVDGRWRLEPDGLRIAEPHYDRILAFGDRTWTDYTITADVTFHGYAPPAAGPPTYGVSHAALGARFPGHAVDDRQPHVQWYPLGAVAEFRLGANLDESSWRIFHGGTTDKSPPAVVEPRPRRVELGVRYRLKLRVDTLPGSVVRYRVKSWLAAEPEPAAWDLETTDGAGAIAAGGALLVAHNTDVTFGDFRVTPNSSDDP